jgi:hypothetical protein
MIDYLSTGAGDGDATHGVGSFGELKPGIPLPALRSPWLMLNSDVGLIHIGE